jgi:hypothetical protein
MKGSPKKVLIGNFIIKDQWENKKKRGGPRLDGHITDPRNKRMEETSRRQGRMEASSKGGQGTEGAVTP